MQRESLLNVDINKVIPYFKNPRKNNKAIPKVAASLKKHGYVKVSVVVDEEDILLAGHTTLAAMKSLEWSRIPEVTKITGLTKSQKLSYRIADNKTGEYAEWDEKLLFENMEEMRLLDGDGFDVSDTGFSDRDYMRMRDSLLPPSAKEVGLPGGEIKTDLRTGDLVHLGRHRVLVGSSTSAADVERLLGKEIAAAVVTSPPYNVGKEGWLGSAESKYEGDDDDKDWREYSDFLSAFTRLYLPKCCYLFLNIQMLRGNKLALIDFLHTFQFNLADIIVWDKETAQPAMAENILNSQFEFILCLKEDTPANRKVGTKQFRGTVSNVYRGPPQRGNENAAVHSATFPMHLPAHLITAFTLPEEVVCDPFLGTGTTLLACEQNGRTCLGMEISPEYVEITCQMWEKFTGQKRVVESLR